LISQVKSSLYFKNTKTTRPKFIFANFNGNINRGGDIPDLLGFLLSREAEETREEERAALFLLYC
jgi:hypothetical protein